MIEKYMKLAIEEAKNSQNDIPVGAVIVRDGEVIAKTHNLKEQNHDVTLHAEIIAIKQVSETLKKWRLDDCELYVTLEPCPMCAWAIIQARIKSVFFGTTDQFYGALGGKIDLRNLLNSNLKIKEGICEKECKILLENYFKDLRK